jgi:sugar lactone lactonase YvrE
LRFQTEGKELEFNGVYRVDVDGKLNLLIDDFALPNGLAFSPDETKLYVDDSAKGHIRVFDVGSDGSLSNGRVLVELKARHPDERGVCDGMKVDSEGLIYCTGPGGVWVVNDAGRIQGRIAMSEVTANVAWGDADWQTLYLTASTSVWRFRVAVPGIPVGRAAKRA